MPNNLKSTLIAIFILFTTTTALAWPIPDTGQTKCYDNKKEIPCPKPGEPFYGQDGNYTINPMSYTKLDERGRELPDSASEWVMVRDNVTGLIWEVKTDDGSVHDKDNKYNWEDAQSDFISRLNREKFVNCLTATATASPKPEKSWTRRTSCCCSIKTGGTTSER